MGVALVVVWLTCGLNDGVFGLHWVFGVKGSSDVEMVLAGVVLVCVQ